MNRRTAAGAAMIVGTSLSIQLAAALAHDLFRQLGPLGASGLRFAFGAVVLLAAVRPALRGRRPEAWGAIAAYGVSMAALNVAFFEAISRIPMGIAVTLGFVGPLAMALMSSRRRLDMGFALLAAAGVATLGGLDRPRSVSGVMFAVAAGIAWVGVAYAGRSVGRHTKRLDGLALALPISALLVAPLAERKLDAVDARALVIGVAIAIGGLILPFALELEGLRRLEPRIVAIVYSVDPGIAALIGFLALSERLTGIQVMALIAVMAASAGATATARSEAPEPVALTPKPATAATDVRRS